MFNMEIRFYQIWFSPKSLKRILAIATVVHVIGEGLSGLIPYLFIKDGKAHTKEHFQQFYNYTSFLIGYSVTSLICVLFIFREYPPDGYGYLNNRSYTLDYFKSFKEYIKGIKEMYSKPYFVRFICILGLHITNTIFLANIINMLMISYGYSQKIGSYMMLLFYINGFFGTFVYDWLFSKSEKQMKHLIQFTCLG